jgi:hypothetical protein
VPTLSLEYARAWRFKNRERLKGQEAEKQRRYRSLFPQRYRDNSKKSYHKHKDKLRARDRERHAQRKITVLTRYGPSGKMQCSWPGCEIVDPDMLSLDHVNNNGYKERKKFGPGARVYLRLTKLDFPLGYQTLCMNHQFKKRAERFRQARHG